MRNKRYIKMSKKELGRNIIQKKRELFEYKYDVRIGVEKDYAQIKYLKKEIASMMSALKNKLEGKNVDRFLNDLGSEKKKKEKKSKSRSAKKKDNLDKKKKDEKKKK